MLKNSFIPSMYTYIYISIYLQFFQPKKVFVGGRGRGGQTPEMFTLPRVKSTQKNVVVVVLVHVPH